MMNRVSGKRSMIAAPASMLPQHRHVHREIVTGGCARDALEAGMIRIPVAARVFRDLDSNADRARRFLPLRDHVGYRGIVDVQRLHDREAIRMRLLRFHCIARVVAVHRESRDQDRAVDAELVHRRDVLVGGCAGRPVRRADATAASACWLRRGESGNR